MEKRTFANNPSISKIVDEKDSKHVFAALKLIEQLYHDGLISVRTFQNILNDYADIVDLSQFVIYEEMNGKESDENV
ncbi:MAG: hypothetical protein J6X61_01955 [Clostridia bacterium]|nr:hypothetical protein [Clostridia bacterium]